MLGNHKLVLDTRCEVFEHLRSYADAEFWDLSSHEIIPGAIYLIGRQQFKEYTDVIKQHLGQNNGLFILSNPGEGSFTMKWQIRDMGIDDLVKSGKILIIGGGDMEPCYPCLRYDTFMIMILNYKTNLIAGEQNEEIFSKTNKPYKFLFLNGLARPHRKYLIEKFRLTGLLEQSLWTSLDSKGFNSRVLQLKHDGENLMLRPGTIRYLPEEYEFPQFRKQITKPINTTGTFVKHHLFDNDWGEIYLYPKQYIDTYFSLVTETVFDYPYSFRTEKIWKPIVIGHPWIAVANEGYYRDIKNLGFRTFDGLIDESFDSIENNKDRINRISDIVHDLCKQDLASFVQAAKEVCKYNQQHLRDAISKEKQQFLPRFNDFISPYLNE